MAMADPIYGEALSFRDIAASMGADGRHVNMIEILNKRNPILSDLRSVEANSGLFHVTAVRTGLPEGTKRAYYQGVKTEKATATQQSEKVSLLESIAKPDAALLEVAANRAQVLADQDRGFVTGLGQRQARSIFYGDPKIDPNDFRGLAPRYNFISDDPMSPGYQVIDAGGEGANLTSIYLVKWGSDAVHGIYPRGSVAGLQVRDMGIQLALDSAGLEYRASVQHYSWYMGLVVADYRKVVRVANIDVSQITDTTSDMFNKLGDLIWDAIGTKFFDMTGEGTSFYCSPKVWTAFMKLARGNSRNNMALPLVDWNGRTLPSINNMLLKPEDAISEHEQRVVAA